VIAVAARRRVFDAKVAMLRRSHVAEFRRLQSNERLDPEAVGELTRSGALAIARYAFAASPFYRERFAAAGFSSSDLDDPGVLTNLPITEKADLRENYERVQTAEATPRNAIPQATGGSTGQPLRVMHDLRSQSHLLSWRMYQWWGVHPADAQALLWRPFNTPGTWRARGQALFAWPARTLRLNANHLDEPDMVAFLEQWERARPRLLTGYVGAVLELGRFLQESGRPITSPVAISVTAAPVTAAQKAFLHEVFGAPVFECYQCMEMPMIAGECGEGDGLHAFSDRRWLEILDDNGSPAAPGETGSVVLTDLRNRAFPLIRYRLGDRASWKTDGCRCGRPFPVLNPIGGRISDNLHLPSGLTVAGESMVSLFNAWPDAVRQFQLVQHVDQSLTLRCVRGSDPRADQIMSDVVDRLVGIVGGEVPVRLEVVEAIAHDRGKSRFILREEAGPPLDLPGQAASSSPSTSRNRPAATS
jgi:phenylacetate-CoA ligase